jgi:hypothetical protein
MHGSYNGVELHQIPVMHVPLPGYAQLFHDGLDGGIERSFAYVGSETSSCLTLEQS